MMGIVVLAQLLPLEHDRRPDYISHEAKRLGGTKSAGGAKEHDKENGPPPSRCMMGVVVRSHPLVFQNGKGPDCLSHEAPRTQNGCPASREM